VRDHHMAYGHKAELKEVPTPAEAAALHPAMLARYEQQPDRLQDAISQGIPGTGRGIR